MKFLKSLLAFFAFSAVMVQATPQISSSDISSSYFHGRSGEVLLSGRSGSSLDSMCILSSDNLHVDSAPSSLPMTDFSDLVLNTMGSNAMPLKSTSEAVTSFLEASHQLNAKSHPKAYVQFVVESVGESTISELSLTHLSSSSSSAMKFHLSSSRVSPMPSSLSVATTLATGMSPSRHGIVSDSWVNTDGQQIQAFTTEQSFAQRENLADVITQRTDGQGFVLSVSAQPQLAQVFAANPQHNKKHNKNQFVIALKNNHFTSLLEEQTIPALHDSLDQLIQRISNPSTSALSQMKNVRVHDFTVSMNMNGHSIQFNLNNKADRTFFAELQYVHDLPQKLKSVHNIEKKLNDKHQDFLSISFSSITSLIDTHGREAEQVKGALNLLDAAYPSFMASYATLFNKPASHMQSLILLGSHKSVLDNKDNRQVMKTIAHIVGQSEKDVQQHFPNIYMKHNKKNAQKACAELNKELYALGYFAFCPHDTHSFVSMAATISNSSGNTSGGNSTWNYPTGAQVRTYQIVLWLSILLVFVIYSAVYALAYMDFKKDTMLYSSFNPNWEDRKRR